MCIYLLYLEMDSGWNNLLKSISSGFNLALGGGGISGFPDTVQ